MVTAIAGTEPGAVVGEGLQTTADLVAAALATSPLALASFFAALAVVGVGGLTIVFTLRIGTLTVVVASEQQTEGLEREPVGAAALERASAYSLGRVYDGARHFARRALHLAAWLGALYAVVGGTYLAAIVLGLSMAVRLSWMPAWPLLMLAATAVGVVAFAVIKLAYDLLQVVIVTDDCSVALAAGRLRAFVLADSRQVIAIFSVMAAIVVLATAASVFAAAGIAVMAWVPFVSLVVVPLQAATWLVRGLVFQFVELSALAAYQTQYRRFSAAGRAAALTAR
jgi:hypothetical protein